MDPYDTHGVVKPVFHRAIRIIEIMETRDIKEIRQIVRSTSFLCAIEIIKITTTFQPSLKEDTNV